MDEAKSIYNFLVQALINSLYQFLSVFGIILLFGILLYVLSRSTRKAFSNSGHSNLDIFFTGWIGTPVHEIGHAVFCILFGHRIKEIKLFKPNSEDGTLGYVKHSYDSKSLFQRIGCFFIGTGPIIFGTIVLFLLLYFLLPNYREISRIISGTTLSGYNFINLLKHTGSMSITGFQLLSGIFSPENFKEPYFWMFIYLSFCVSSHMQLSPSDLKSMLTGLITILLIFLLVNVVTSFIGVNITSYIPKFSQFYGRILNIFILATAISFANFVISYTILASIQLVRKKGMLSFW
jgi:hypothetical protein